MAEDAENPDYERVSEADLSARLAHVARKAPARRGFPYDQIDELIDIVGDTGRISLGLQILGISPVTFHNLLDEAEAGKEHAMQAVQAIFAAKGCFEGSIIEEVKKNPHTALVKLLDKVTPDDWHSGPKVSDKPDPAKGFLAGANVTLQMPDNGRTPKAIDVEVVDGD